jgi:ribulose-phosphate 3-epimerase
MPSQSALERLRAASPTISVGMLTADLGHLADALGTLETSGVDVVHYDVMDGVFCPMTTIGPPVVAAVETDLIKDVHLMVTDPERKVADYVAAGADVVTVHVEAGDYVHRALQELSDLENARGRERGIVRGIGLLPGTPVDAIEPLLDRVDLVLLVTINPGWGGQAFGVETPRRVEQVRNLLERSGGDILLGVDGGVTRKNIREVAGLGPDLIITGSAVFDGRQPAENARYMLEAVRDAAKGS